MEPNFAAFQLIGQIALGIIGFSAILIGLSRTSEGFSDPDNFRVQLLTYSAFGAMFGSILISVSYYSIGLGTISTLPFLPPSHARVTATMQDKQEAFGQVIPLIVNGTLKANIDSRYTVDQIEQAVTRAWEGEYH